jgi:glyoxylase-like metal-dependent hydrolase (beta-lactamase superfamily II)
MANFFLVAENDELTLIDTGNKDSLDNIRGKIKEKGYNLDQLKRIVITHAHFDHAANVGPIKEASGAKVMAHEAEVPYITGKDSVPRPGGIGGFLFHVIEPFFRPPPVDVDVTVKDGDTIEGTGLTVIHAPGHTPGSICLYHAGARALFPGDLLINRSWKLTGPISFFSSDINEARRSVGRLVDLDIETIYFSHGGTMKDVPKGLVRDFLPTLK